MRRIVAPQSRKEVQSSCLDAARLALFIRETLNGARGTSKKRHAKTNLVVNVNNWPKEDALTVSWTLADS